VSVTVSYSQGGTSQEWWVFFSPLGLQVKLPFNLEKRRHETRRMNFYEREELHRKWRHYDIADVSHHR